MEKEIKRIGSNVDIKGIVIHQVVKDQGIRHTSLKEATGLIKFEEKEKSFLGRLNKAYFRKSSPIYGIFGDEDTTFKKLLIE